MASTPRDGRHDDPQLLRSQLFLQWPDFDFPEEDLGTLAAAQFDMLGNAADAVAPGGRLIYATCSSEPEENESVAETFLARSPEFSAWPLAAAGTSVPTGVINQRGHLRTYPHIHGLEAFFGAVFARL